MVGHHKGKGFLSIPFLIGVPFLNCPDFAKETLSTFANFDGTGGK